VLNLTKTTLRSNSQTRVHISGSSYAPTTNKANWALGTMAPHMLMGNNYFPRAVNTVNNNSLV
jgi:hypothetical protein